MAYLSDFVKSTLSRVVLGKEIPSFPYTIGERIDSFDSTIWSLHRGIKREDNSPVSILCFDCVRQRDKLPLARNAFKKFRTIRHPDLIKYIDGVETESHIYIVTDAVTPLETHLRANINPNLIRWGLYKVANVLRFLTVDASFIHGNIRTSSIFTTKSGEWKVGGFEVLSSLKEDQPAILTFAGLIPDSNRYAPPEVKKKSWNVVKEYELWSTDTWHYACLIYEVYNGAFTSPDQLMTPGQIPAEMVPFYKNLLRPDPKTRPSVGDFLDKGLQAKGFFHNDLVQVVLFLENFSVKESLQRDTFLRKLDMQIDRFPQEFCRYKILPELIHALEYGSGGARVLPPIVKIGAGLDEQEYETLISSVLVKMFASTDRTIRLSLLENLGGFINRINKKVVNDKIFPSMALGFTDTAPIIREWTVKSVLLIINKLSDKVINYDLLRYLGKLQTDEEPGIRTNTIICLGKIAKYLNDNTKGKILVPAFTRSLRDPFAHARIASLMALNATSESYDKNDIAVRIIPCISLTLVDTEKIVRVQALKSLDTFIKRIEKLIENMPDSAIVDAGRDSPNGGSRSATPSTPSSETWAGWAVSSITKKLVTGEMQPQAVSPQLGNDSPSSANIAPSTGNGMSLSSASNSSNGLQIAAQGGYAGARPADGFSVNRYSSALAAIEKDEATNSGGLSGWGDGDEDLFADEGFEPMEPTTPSPMVSSGTIKPTTSTTITKPLRNANSAMSLGPKPSARLGFGAVDDGSTDAWDGDDDLFKNLNLSNGGGGSTSTGASRPLSSSLKPLSRSSSTSSNSITASSFTGTTPASGTAGSARKEEKMAELARKREERRQRMAEAKERKAQSTLGAKKI
ncbi:armadillo-type protein [Lobosporangium transversale]|uniref:Armadillo-type protein n=1 Tax=Lobosporangium transversale TaxID=64571 RepID=A0A1Y2GRP8_9FUNG|nr:armadillo-type protein [Lobosporangium transversale]ORZ18413.1 armadillo-type protein [Lobosporangium transversale]|eukprot:XP_021882208.1 armadillo-type protein [Lobosporangium transversale]